MLDTVRIIAEHACYGEGHMLVTVGVVLVTVKVAAEHDCHSGSHACCHEGYGLNPKPVPIFYSSVISSSTNCGARF